MKIAIDTNVLIDLVSPEREHHDLVKRYLFKSLPRTGESVEVCTFFDSIFNLQYILKRKDPLFYDLVAKISNKIRLIEYTTEDLEFATELCRTGELNDIEDATKVFCAMRWGVEVLITNDKELLGSADLFMSEEKLAILSFKEYVDSFFVEKKDSGLTEEKLVEIYRRFVEKMNKADSVDEKIKIARGQKLVLRARMGKAKISGILDKLEKVIEKIDEIQSKLEKEAK